MCAASTSSRDLRSVGHELERGSLKLWAGRYESVPHPRGAGGAAHSYAVVLLVTRGTAKVTHGIELQLRAGDVHLIPPGDTHSGAPFGDAGGWAVAFRPDAFSRDEADWSGDGILPLDSFARVRGGCHPVLRPTAAQRRVLLQWIRALERETADSERRHDEAVAALLNLLLIELDRIATPVSVEEAPGLGLARRALSYIEANCLQRLSLTDVARAVGRSSAHVATTVRRETGRTVGEWLVEHRMAEARRRLRGTDEHVDVIAERVGYADVTHFTRLFKRAHGMTPAAWRRSVSRR